MVETVVSMHNNGGISGVYGGNMCLKGGNIGLDDTNGCMYVVYKGMNKDDSTM
jgi:hypothetical protein